MDVSIHKIIEVFNLLKKHLYFSRRFLTSKNIRKNLQKKKYLFVSRKFKNN